MARSADHRAASAYLGVRCGRGRAMRRLLASTSSKHKKGRRHDDDGGVAASRVTTVGAQDEVVEDVAVVEDADVVTERLRTTTTTTMGVMVSPPSPMQEYPSSSLLTEATNEQFRTEWREAKDALKALERERERVQDELNDARRARDLERDMLKDELVTSAEHLARLKSANEELRGENDKWRVAATDAATYAESLEVTLHGMCDVLSQFSRRCASLGIVEESIASRADDNPGFWIELNDGETCERPRALLRAATDAFAASRADYETRIAEAQTAAIDERFGEQFQLEMRAQVERAIGHLELERANNDSPASTSAAAHSSGARKLYRTPDVVARPTSDSHHRELEAERREAHERIVALEQEMHTLKETTGAIERELREELDKASSDADSRNIVIHKLEIELRRLEGALQSADDATVQLTRELEDVTRRAQEDAEQERRRSALAARSKDAEIADLSTRVNDSKARVDELNAENKRLNDTLTQQRQLKQKLEDQVAGCEARIEGLLQEIDAMDTASAQASTHVSNAMASASEAHQRAMSDMRTRFAEAEAYIEALESRESVVEDERNVLKRELDKARAREKELRNHLKDAETRAHELTTEINALLEQESRRSALLRDTEQRIIMSPRRAPPNISSTKKLNVREISDGECSDDDGDEFVVVRTSRARTAPNSPYMIGMSGSPLSARQLRGLQSAQSGANSALALARAELAEARAKRDRNVRKLEI